MPDVFWPLSDLRESLASEFKRASERMRSDAREEAEQARARVTSFRPPKLFEGFDPESFLPSVAELTPWAQPKPAQQQATATATADPLPSIESLTPWAPRATPSAAPPGGAALASPAAMPTGAPVAAGGDLKAHARAMAQKYGVDPDIFERQITQESGWNPTARSPAGAAGIAQFMPGTARGMGLADPFEPYSALDAAARHMADNLKANGGDYARALAAYNAGQGAVNEYGGVPPYKETQDYVRIILGPGRPAPNAGVAAPATPPPAPVAGPPAATGASQDMVTLENVDDGKTKQVPSSQVPSWLKPVAPGMPPSWRVVGPVASASPLDEARAANQGGAGVMMRQQTAVPMPEDATAEDAMLQRSGQLTTPLPAPMRNVVPYDPETMQPGDSPATMLPPGSERGGPPSGSDIPMFRQPLSQQPELPADEDVGVADIPAVERPYDPDQDPREGGREGFTPLGPELPPVSQAEAEEAGRSASQVPAQLPVWNAQGQVIGYRQDDASSPASPDRWAQAEAEAGGPSPAAEIVPRSYPQAPPRWSGEQRREGEDLFPIGPPAPATRIEDLPAERVYPFPPDPSETRLTDVGVAPRPQRPREPLTPPGPERAPFQDEQREPAAPPALPGTPTLPGAAGRILSEDVRRAQRSQTQQMSPLAIYAALQELPFDVYARARRELISDAEARRMSGTDPLAPFRGLGIALPSAEDLNPEGRPASDVFAGLLASGALPDPADPGVALAFRGAARAAGAVSGGARAATEAAQGAGQRVRGAVAANAERVAAADARIGTGAGEGSPGHDTPFVVYDRRGQEVTKTTDENYAARLAQENGGRYEFDQTPPLLGEKPQSTEMTVEEAVQRGYRSTDGDGNPVTPEQIAEEVHRARSAAPQPGDPTPYREPLPPDRQGPTSEIDQALTSDYGRRIEETPDVIRGEESIRRARAARNEEPSPSDTQVPPNFYQQPLVRDDMPRGGGINLNATPGVSVSSGTAIGTRLAADIGSSAGGGVMGAAVGAGAPAETPEERRRNALIGAGAGMVAGPAAPRLMRRGGGALATLGVSPVGGPRQFANPADALAAAQAAIGTPNPRGPVAGLNRMEALRRWIVRNGTDNRVDLNEFQREAQRLLGRPLEVDEMLSELTRVNPTGPAKIMIDDAIKPALQQVGDERANLSTLMRLMNNGDVAAATGNPNRTFSGGLTGADSQAAAAHLWSQLTPGQQKLIDQSSDALYQVVNHYRDEMVRAGVWTPALAADLKATYPHWVPTKILDYMSDPATVSSGARSISLRDRGLRAYTIDGTAKAAEDPIASLVRYVQDAETIIQKNEAFNAFVNLRDRVPGWDQLMQEVPSNTAPARARGEKTVTGFVNGERKTFVVPAPMAAAIQMEQGQQVPILRELTQVFKEFITRTPMFVAGQIPLDAFAYTVRESGRAGSPLAAPKVVAELARGYAEAFKGLLSGEFKGDTARYLKEGGAMAGFYERAADAASKSLDDLTRRNMFEVRNAADAKKLTGWLLGGGWVQAAGARVELAPRVASFRLGEQRALKAGASAEKAALEAMIGGRDVTLDFQRGGVAAKVMNQIIPFFNVGVQSATTLPRMLRENPTGAATTLLSLVAAPTIAVEAWNRMDEQRSKDYDDVPDYVKDRGIVIMLPGVEGRDERGERRPNYALIPLREMAPVAIMARDLSQRVMGTSQRGVGESALAMLSAASPVQASGAADLFSSVLPPVASTGLQLAADRDFFRGGPIKTERRDENASALAAGVADVTGARKSEADFAIRDLFGGVGAMASAASDLATGKAKDEQRLQNTPLVGGLASRFVGDAVGGNLTRAQDARTPDAIRPTLEAANMQPDDVKPVPSRWHGAQLTRAEQAKWQMRTNRLIGHYVREARTDSEWSDRSRREDLVNQAMARAKADASEQSFTFDPAARIEREEHRKRKAR